MLTITREEHNRFPTKTPTNSASLCETEARRAGGADALRVMFAIEIIETHWSHRYQVLALVLATFTLLLSVGLLLPILHAFSNISLLIHNPLYKGL